MCPRAALELANMAVSLGCGWPLLERLLPSEVDASEGRRIRRRGGRPGCHLSRSQNCCYQLAGTHLRPILNEFYAVFKLFPLE